MSRELLDQLMEVLPDAKRYQGYLACICPFHNDHRPSMIVTEDGWFRCLSTSCGAKGRAEKLLNLSPAAVAGVEKSYNYYPADIPEDVGRFQILAADAISLVENRTYLLERRIWDETISSCELGYYDGWYTIPVHSYNGNLLGHVLRASPWVEKMSGLRFLVRCPSTFYTPDTTKLTDERRYVLVTYGMFDALSLYQAGFTVVTPITGAKAFKPEWFDMYRLPFYFIPDLGEEEVACEHARQMGWRGRVIQLDYPVGKDPNDYYQAGLWNELKEEIKAKIK